MVWTWRWKTILKNNVQCRAVNCFEKHPMNHVNKKKLQQRKEKIEARLIQHGIDDFKITDVSDLEESHYDFSTPHEAAQRLLILLALAFTAYNFDESEKVMDWLKKENLWKAVSEKEKEFFRNPEPGEDEKRDLSWRFEGAYVLAWALQKIKLPPNPADECNEDQVNEFLVNVPTVGSVTQAFFNNLQFRAVDEILDETIFSELATAYFRDLHVTDKANTSTVHARAVYERLLALNWLRGLEEESGQYDD